MVLAVLAAPAIAQASESEDNDTFQLGATYVGEVWRNAAGGLRTGWRYLDKLDIRLEVNGERAWGLEGLTLFADALYTNGHELSADLIGDAQVASNIEAAPHPLVYELWADWAFGPRADHSLRIGLYDLNSEFDSSEVAALFINSAHGIGSQLAQTGTNGPSIFPVTSFGARLRISPAEHWALLFAALDADPGNPWHPRRFEVDFAADEGLLLATEVSRAFSAGARVALGGWRYTSRFDDLVEADAQGAPRRGRGNGGVYLLVDAQIWESRRDTRRALKTYVRAGTANGHINRFDRFAGLGVVLTSPFGARADDRLGLGLTVPRNGRAYRERQRREGVDTESVEYAVELTYLMQLGPLSLQPVVEYIGNPDTRREVPNALAMGLRFSLER